VLSLDWRGHGESALQDFGTDALVQDALAVIAASGAQRIVPVALAHAGWVALKLRQRLGARVAGLVLLDWIVLDPPPPFLEALDGLQSTEQSEAVWKGLRASWVEGVAQAALRTYVADDMGGYGFDMRARAGREIARAYAGAGNPLRALSALEPAVQTLHLYAQPEDAAYLQAQREFAAEHPWFHVQRLHAASHFPMFETPDELTAAIDAFVEGAARTSSVRSWE
jgi:pimeloyl-ACP methyl ester carboxylesterase